MRHGSGMLQLQAGQVLSRPLYHPLTGQVLVAAGIALGPKMIERIRSLSLLEIALKCVDWRTSAVAPPPGGGPDRDLGDVQEQTGQLEELLARGVGMGLDVSAAHQFLGPAMSMIEAILLRLQQVERHPGIDLRIYGGGEFAHPVNVMLYASLLGIRLDLPWKKLLALAQAALLHDIGKRLVSTRRLAGRMRDYERRVMERHPEFGVDIVKQIKRSVPQIQEDTLMGILAHHERWDGNGTPHGWKGEGIPLIARILTVADVYESMTTDQRYWPRMLSGSAHRDIVALANRAFDPRVTEAFGELIMPYPDHALLSLEDGSEGRVIRQGQDAYHPLVRLATGEELDLGQPGAPGITRHQYPRRHVRHRVEVPLVVQALHAGAPFRGETVELSPGGACVRLDQEVEPGASLLVQLEAEEVRATVAWKAGGAAEARWGLRFSALPSHAEAALRALLPEGPIAE